ncbi:potassium-transporting ATPase subunit KdpC [Gorillibacterium massiliense]|uniref:potassium-transporting ATPase subunit KdpC n=1 Tax=Gorillibacterium massiliense TaxID=1280390 RepID=UPI0004AD27A0|nr:potassium-transporting ATPase subunit KdpC [Gorillibacterium massiliense]
MKMLGNAIRVSIVLMLICGFIYPMVTTGFAQVLMHKQANGSLIKTENGIAGSSLIAQQVESPKLFHPRASAAKYDPTASAGSNQAVASEDYASNLAKNVEAVKQDNPGMTDVPADLVTGSGSGLDPDLSPAAAKAQAPRISRETGISEEELDRLIDNNTKKRQLGIFGEPHVNVTELNMDLLKLLK